MPDPLTNSASPHGPTGPSVLLAAAWLIPGAGLIFSGLKNRGLAAFILLQTTFVIGLLFRGSVSLPDLSAGADGFNIVAILVFIISMGNGGLGLLSLVSDIGGGAVPFLPYNPAHDYADLGQLYILVSGGMNYFLLMSLLSPVGSVVATLGKGVVEEGKSGE